MAWLNIQISTTTFNGTRLIELGMNAMARPKKNISEDQVKALAEINCSYAEMAAVLDCDEKTLTNRFSQVIKKGRESGRSSLKRKQWELAMGGNVTMCIWLGKQLLGQTDKIDNDYKVVIQKTFERLDGSKETYSLGPGESEK